MKNIFIRVALVWMMAGQILLVCWPYFGTRTPTELERAFALDPNSRTSKEAMEGELDRLAEYHARHDVGIITLLLAMDGVLIVAFWNFGASKGLAAAAGGRPLTAPMQPGVGV